MKGYDLTNFLQELFLQERDRQDRGGIYAFTQRRLAYNSNRIEGSTLTEEQTLTLFEQGMLPASDDVYRAKDIEETQGHFLTFNKMLDTLDAPLTENLIKQFHYELKSGVFEDRANGYAVGEYKTRPNRIGLYDTASPAQVHTEMARLLAWYRNIQEKDLHTLAEFHAAYESIHPFQDGNGRTGRMILFRECLTNGIAPLIIRDGSREEYRNALVSYRSTGSVNALTDLFEKEQDAYLEKNSAAFS